MNSNNVVGQIANFASKRQCACRWIFALLVAPFLGGCATYSLSGLEKSLVYQPLHLHARNWSAPAHLGFEEAEFQAADGVKLHGWFIDHPERRGVVLFAHGNGGNVAVWSKTAYELSRRHRVAVLVFDYRGYGKSEGAPSEQGLIADAEAARRWLAARTGASEESVILMGQSLGGGVVLHLADSPRPPRGLILLSTFTSAPDVAAHHFPWLPVRTLMTQRYHSLDKIKNYRGPLLVCHGDADQTIPFAQGERLFEAAPGEDKTFVRHAGGDHNDPPPEEFHAALDAFLERLPKETPYLSNIRGR